MAEEDKVEEKHQHKKKDAMREIELQVQKAWYKDRIYEIDAPSADSKEFKDHNKFLCTFPYPYMNGVLHLGHAFTLSKVEFAARYQRLRGKQVLFPFGFHCTGMPIAACANKLKSEIAKYGNPPHFPEATEKPKTEEQPAAEKRKVKGKVAKKKGKASYQWDIMLEMGVDAAEIPKFQEATHWLKYFPPICKEDLELFGLSIDFRRSFITTDMNRYYDAFIRWQFNTLKALDKIEFGKRPAIYSPIDQQPCADHDRASGEQVKPQEYTLIKLLLVQPYPAKLKAIKGLENKKVYLPAATLRPETMYGQTNCFMLPEGEYGVHAMNDNEVFICSPRSALNMSYQDMFGGDNHGKPVILGSVMGMDMMGAAVEAPLCMNYKQVYVLPLLSIKMNKGTGVVTSVPSDAPDDFAALYELQHNAGMRKQYHLKDEMVLPFKVVPIIEIPGLGDQAAAKLCLEQKVFSVNQRVQLDLIKDKVYQEGFTKGTMLVGEHKGKKVSEAKPLVRKTMISQGLAASYFEPESPVISRSGNECVVALTDQWYLRYGEPGWKAPVAAHIDNVLNCYNPIAKKMFQDTIQWLEEWACSRQFGLGTRLPWDTKWVIESLSDSTIYMAYYTIAQFLHADIFGTTPTSAHITPEMLTDDVFDYLFLAKAQFPKSTPIPKAILDKMKNEFQYWYPVDLRVSGKDLIGNHLTMMLYNHSAIWDDPKMWPQSFFTNGHAMIDAEKMSKSTGNFLTLRDAIEEFSADATRFALADAGDGLEDANFAKDVANQAILKLTKESTFIQRVLEDEKYLRTKTEEFWDNVFSDEIDHCIHNAQTAYDKMLFHDVTKHAFFEMLACRDEYRKECPVMRKDLIEKWSSALVKMNSPICPHWAQNIWTNFLHQAGDVGFSGWPVAGQPSADLQRKITYLRSTQKALHSGLSSHRLKQKKADKEEADAVLVFVAKEFKAWQTATLKVLTDAFAVNPDVDMRSTAGRLHATLNDKSVVEQAMKFAKHLLDEAKSHGHAVFDLHVPFDEFQLLNAQLPFITRDQYLQHIEIRHVDEKSELGSDSVPGRPTFIFYNQKDGPPTAKKAPPPKSAAPQKQKKVLIVYHV